MTQVLTFNQLHHLNIREDASTVKKSAIALFSLISGETLNSEIGIMKSIVLKITIRLRSARVTMILNQLMKRIDRYRCLDVRRLISPTTAMIFT